MFLVFFPLKPFVLIYFVFIKKLHVGLSSILSFSITFGCSGPVCLNINQMSNEIINYSFLEVYKMLEGKKFDELKVKVDEIPFILSSLLGENNQTLLMEAASSLDARVFEFLLEFGHQDFAALDKKGWNIVYYIIDDSDGCVEKLELLKSKPPTFTQLINHSDKYDTLLHYAAWHNRHEAIKYLMENGAIMDIPNNVGKLPGEQYSCDKETKNLIRDFRSKRYLLSFFKKSFINRRINRVKHKHKHKACHFPMLQT